MSVVLAGEILWPEPAVEAFGSWAGRCVGDAGDLGKRSSVQEQQEYLIAFIPGPQHRRQQDAVVFSLKNAATYILPNHKK